MAGPPSLTIELDTTGLGRRPNPKTRLSFPAAAGTGLDIEASIFPVFLESSCGRRLGWGERPPSQSPESLWELPKVLPLKLPQNTP